MKVKNGYVFIAVNKENGKYYIGKRVSYLKTLTEDYCKNEIYYGSGVGLPKYGCKREANYQFERSKHFIKDILHIGSDYEEKEEFFLELYDAENDPNSYNRTNSGGSKGTTLNKIAINKEGEIRFVSHDQLESFLNDGWVKGMNLVAIYKDNEIKKVSFEELQSYLDAGWSKTNPFPATKNTKWMYKNGASIMVPADKVDDYLLDNWELGCLSKGNAGKFFVMNNSTGDRLYIEPYQLEEYVQQGYTRCSSNPNSNKNTVHMHKDGKQVMVKRSEVDIYLTNGYIFGRPFSSSKGKIHIIKDSKTKVVPESELEAYLLDGWIRGSYMQNTHSKGRIWIHNEIGSKMINVEDLDKFLSDGYIKGRGKLRS